MDIRTSRPADVDFPTALRHLARPVAALWYRGRLPTADDALVAIVGARAASGRATSAAAAMADALARAGLGTVSGGALGVDAAAHRGALDGGAPTYAVLGCGVDVIYPDRHGPLYDRITGRGGLLSELPPGAPPRSGHFPVRNRIVAALARAVVVIEAGRVSGALSTAACARRMGRPVLAVPGSAGTDALLAAGAAPIATAEDVLRVLGGGAAAAREIPEAWRPLLAAVEAGAHTATEVAARLALPIGETLAWLGAAELDGWLRRRAGGVWEVPGGR